MTQKELNNLITEAVKKQLKESKPFKKTELSKFIDDAASKLWDGYNTLDKTISNYFKSTGQDGMVTAFRKKYKLDQLESILNGLDD